MKPFYLLFFIGLLITGCTTVIDHRPIEKVYPTYVMKIVSNLSIHTNDIWCVDYNGQPINNSYELELYVREDLMINKHYETDRLISDVEYPLNYIALNYASRDNDESQIDTCNSYITFTYKITTQNRGEENSSSRQISYATNCSNYNIDPYHSLGTIADETNYISQFWIGG